MYLFFTQRGRGGGGDRPKIKVLFTGATFHIPLTKSTTMNRLLHCSLWQKFSGSFFIFKGSFFAFLGVKSLGAPV